MLIDFLFRTQTLMRCLLSSWTNFQDERKTLHIAVRKCWYQL